MLVLGGLVCRDRWGGECWLESPSFSTFSGRSAVKEFRRFVGVFV